LKEVVILVMDSWMYWGKPDASSWTTISSISRIKLGSIMSADIVIVLHNLLWWLLSCSVAWPSVDGDMVITEPFSILLTYRSVIETKLDCDWLRRQQHRRRKNHRS